MISESPNSMLASQDCERYPVIILKTKISVHLYIMNAFSYIFLIALFVSFAIQFWLSRRQMTHVNAHQHAVPKDFKETITLEAHQKAAAYTIDKGQIGIWQSIFSTLLLVVITLGGGIEQFAHYWTQAQPDSPILSGVCMMLSVMIAMHILEMPFSLYQTFTIEERYGFNRTTVAQYLKDMVIQGGLLLAIGLPILALILWVMESVGSFWWLLAWGLLTGISLLMSWVFPIWIAPLFNEFTPLEEGDLKNRIQSLLEKSGFSSNGIFVMDGSKRSGHGNAYFTGMGKNKRIVFFDTLVESLEGEELEAVLAHELGHFKCKHVIKMLIASTLISLSGFAVLGWLAEQQWFYTGLGVSEISNATALLLFMLVSPAFTLFLQPISAYFQRRYEFEADNFAATITQPSALISGLVKLYRENASTLTPDPIYSAFHYSHPPAAIRIANLNTQQTPTPSAV